MEPKLELIGQLSSRSKRSAVAVTVAMGFPHLSLTCFPPVTGTFKCNPPIRKCDFRPYIRDIQILYIYIYLIIRIYAFYKFWVPQQTGDGTMYFIAWAFRPFWSLGITIPSLEKPKLKPPNRLNSC